MKPCLAIGGDVCAKFSPRINQGHQHDKRFSTCYKHLSPRARPSQHCRIFTGLLLCLLQWHTWLWLPEKCPALACSHLLAHDWWSCVFIAWASQWEDKSAIWYYSHLRPEAAAKLCLKRSMLQHPDTGTHTLAIKLSAVIHNPAGIWVQEVSV